MAPRHPLPCGNGYPDVHNVWNVRMGAEGGNAFAGARPPRRAHPERSHEVGDSVPLAGLTRTLHYPCVLVLLNVAENADTV
jgi:hypothetical protein